MGGLALQAGETLRLGAVTENTADQPVRTPSAPMTANIAEDFEHTRALPAKPGAANR